MLISLADYGKIYSKSGDTLRRMAENGVFRTAKKIGRNWVIDSEEAYPINKRRGNMDNETKNSIHEAKVKEKEAEERAQIMLDSAPLCVYFLNKDSICLDCNEESVKMLGVSKKKIL